MVKKTQQIVPIDEEDKDVPEATVSLSEAVEEKDTSLAAELASSDLSETEPNPIAAEAGPEIEEDVNSVAEPPDTDSHPTAAPVDTEPIVAPLAPPPSDISLRRYRGIIVGAVIVLIIIVLAVILGGKSKPQHTTGSKVWTTYNSSAGNFSALFPNTPSFSQKTEAINGTNYTENTFQATNGSAVYIVVYTTPEHEGDSPTTLNALVQDTVSNLQSGQLVSSTQTTISGHNAEVFQITGLRNSQKVYLSGEFVVVGSTQYALLATQYNSLAPNAQYFLNHFKIDK